MKTLFFLAFLFYSNVLFMDGLLPNQRDKPIYINSTKSLPSQKEGCVEVSELVNLTAPLLERYLDIGLPPTLYRQTDINLIAEKKDTGLDECKLQYQVERDGNVQVVKEDAGKDYGRFAILIPLYITDCRVDWMKKVGFKVRDGRPIKNIKFTLHSTVAFKMNNNVLNTEISNKIVWNDTPYFEIFGIHVTVSNYCETHILAALEKQNEDWRNSFNAVFQKFENQDCGWLSIAKDALVYLNNLPLTEAHRNQLRELFQQFISDHVKP